MLYIIHYNFVIADPLPESETNKFIVGTCGLLLGIVCVAAGLIKYKLKCTGEDQN